MTTGKMTLAALIAEEKRAWAAHTLVCREADQAYFAWRAANPQLDRAIKDKNDLPAPVGDLYRQEEALQTAASAASDRVCAWIPRTLDEAVTLLEWQEAEGTEQPGLAESLLAGLRAIAMRDASHSTRPGGADPEILGMFREWRELWRTTSLTAETNDEVERAGARLTALERRIFDAPAGDARGLAAKAFLVAHLFSDGRSEDGEPRLDGFRPEHYCVDNTLGLKEHAVKGMVESLTEFLPEVRPLCTAVLETRAPEVAR